MSLVSTSTWYSGIRRTSIRMDIRMGHIVRIESRLCYWWWMLEHLVSGMMLLWKTLAKVNVPNKKHLLLSQIWRLNFRKSIPWILGCMESNKIVQMGPIELVKDSLFRLDTMDHMQGRSYMWGWAPPKFLKFFLLLYRNF